MKMKMKAIVVAVALGITGAAQADIDSDGMPGFGAKPYAPVDSGGIGELFISMIARSATNSTLNNSYVFDTGIIASTFVDAWLGGTLGSLNGMNVALGADANYNAFITDNSSTDFSISYNMLAVHNDETVNPTTYAPANAGFLTSTVNPLVAGDGPQGSATAFNQAANNIGLYTVQVNNLMPGTSFATNDSMRANATSPAFHDGVNWGNKTIFGFATEGTFDSALNFYFIGPDGNTGTLTNPSPASIVPANFGSWTLASATGDLTFSTVPLPAAVWLFGAGLMGLVGVARRRSA